MMLSHVLPLSLMSVLACVGACTGVGQVVQVLAEYTDAESRALTIATLNMEGTPSVVGSDAEATTRTRVQGVDFRRKVEPWGIIGLQEVYYERDSTGLFNLGHVLLRNETFPCPNGGSGEAAECFARGFRNASADSERALGLVWNRDFWEIVGGTTTDHIGLPRSTIIFRTVFGARFMNQRSGKIVPVFSTHISNAANCSGGVCSCGSDCRERFSEELRDLVATIRLRQISGDLPPVLVGDFNCGGWDNGHRAEVLNHFSKASDVNSVDLVFVGRAESFPSSGERWVAVPDSTRRESIRSTDHRATVVKLVTETPPTPSDVALSGPVFMDPTLHCP